MTPTRFALRADHETFAGGQLAYGDDAATFDIGAELQRGGGVISIDPDVQPDPVKAQILVSLLKEYPALKVVGPTEAERTITDSPPPSEPPQPPAQPAIHGDETFDRETLEALSAEDLHGIARERAYPELPKSTKKADLVKHILDNQQEA